MSEDWDTENRSYENGSGSGRGRGRGNSHRSTHDYEGSSQDNWGNENNSGWGENNGDHESGTRGRGGRGGGRRGGRGGENRFSERNGGGGDYNGQNDDQPPMPEKPRPTYIPPEINDDDCNGVEVGTNFNQYNDIEVKVKGDSVPKHIESFQKSGLREVLIEKLASCNYTIPTPIQKYSIPIVINGRDMMASAQTGSGKTVSHILLYIKLIYLTPFN